MYIYYDIHLTPCLLHTLVPYYPSRFLKGFSANFLAGEKYSRIYFISHGILFDPNVLD